MHAPTIVAGPRPPASRGARPGRPGPRIMYRIMEWSHRMIDLSKYYTELLYRNILIELSNYRIIYRISYMELSLAIWDYHY